jgi:hypothetical protein
MALFIESWNLHHYTDFIPIFRKMQEVHLEYWNYKSKLLVRAADIVVNRTHFMARNEKRDELDNIEKMNVICLL